MAKLSVVKNSEEPATGKPGGEAKEPAVEETKKGGKPTGLFLLIGAVIVGAGLGAFVLGPRLLPPAGHAAAAAVSGEEDEEAAETGGGKGEEVANTLEYKNIVVNPAGAEGLHFLMVSAVLEVHNARAQKFLRDHEHMVKDTIITSLGSLSMEALSKPGSRQMVKDLIAHEIGQMAGTKRITVYLPEFVVQ